MNLVQTISLSSTNPQAIFLNLNAINSQYVMIFDNVSTAVNNNQIAARLSTTNGSSWEDTPNAYTHKAGNSIKSNDLIRLTVEPVYQAVAQGVSGEVYFYQPNNSLFYTQCKSQLTSGVALSESFGMRVNAENNNAIMIFGERGPLNDGSISLFVVAK
jgi:hypothetical protein